MHSKNATGFRNLSVLSPLVVATLALQELQGGGFSMSILNNDIVMRKTPKVS